MAKTPTRVATRKTRPAPIDPPESDEPIEPVVDPIPVSEPVEEVPERDQLEAALGELAATRAALDELDTQLKERDATISALHAASVESVAALDAAHAKFRDADEAAKPVIEGLNAEIKKAYAETAEAHAHAREMQAAAISAGLDARDRAGAALAAIPVGKLEVWASMPAPVLVAVFECVAVEKAHPGFARVSFTPPHQLDAQNGLGAPTPDRDRWKRSGEPRVTTGAVSVVLSDGHGFVAGEVYRVAFEVFPRS